MHGKCLITQDLITGNSYSMNNIQLIIPMSGLGKRFVEAGYKDPKPLIEVDGYPMIKHVVDIYGNPPDITFICNEDHLRDTNMREILMKISPQAKVYSIKKGLGPVDAVLKIAEFIDDEKETIVSYCDYGTCWNYEKFLEETRQKSADGAIICYTGFHPHMLGSDNYAFVKETEGWVEKVQEKKPFTQNKMNELASNGGYYFRKGSLVKKYFQELVDSGEMVNGEFYVSMVYNLLVRDGLKISTFLIDKMLQWGTPYDLEIYKGWSKYFGREKGSMGAITPVNTTLILPMAGRGSRFEKEGYEIPKPLLNIKDERMFIKAIRCLPGVYNKSFIILQEHVEKYHSAHIINDYFQYAKIYSIDSPTEGQACTCKIAVDELDPSSPILISSCDNGVEFDHQKWNELVSDKSVDVIVWTFRNSQSSKVNPDAYSWLTVDENNYVTNVSTKKFNQEDPLKTHAIIGTFFFRKASYFSNTLDVNVKLNIRTNGEFYVDDVIQRCIGSGLRVKVFEVDHYICWGTPNDYQVYNYWINYFTKCV